MVKIETPEQAKKIIEGFVALHPDYKFFCDDMLHDVYSGDFFLIKGKAHKDEKAELLCFNEIMNIEETENGMLSIKHYYRKPIFDSDKIVGCVEFPETLII